MGLRMCLSHSPQWPCWEPAVLWGFIQARLLAGEPCCCIGGNANPAKLPGQEYFTTHLSRHVGSWLGDPAGNGASSQARHWWETCRKPMGGRAHRFALCPNHPAVHQGWADAHPHVPTACDEPVRCPPTVQSWDSCQGCLCGMLGCSPSPALSNSWGSNAGIAPGNALQLSHECHAAECHCSQALCPAR